MNQQQTIIDTLAKITDILKGAPNQDVLKTLMGAENIQKDYPSGLVGYDLEPAARVLQPVITPLRNRLPRVKGKGGTAANWKQITSLDTPYYAARYTGARRVFGPEIATGETQHNGG